MFRSRPVSPHSPRKINAGSEINIPYQSIDDELNAVTLGTNGIRYRIDNLTDGVRVQNWTTVTGSPPAQSGTINIPAAVNVMTRDHRDRQLNQVTIELTDADGNVRQKLEHYTVEAVFVGVA